MKNTRNKKSCIFLVRKYILYILHRTSEPSQCIHSYMLPLQSPEDPLLFNEILCFPQASGITQQDWVSPHIEGSLYDVTSSSGDRRNNSRRPLTYSITNKNNTITTKERHIMTKYELLIFKVKLESWNVVFTQTHKGCLAGSFCLHQACPQSQHGRLPSASPPGDDPTGAQLSLSTTCPPQLSLPP